MQLRQRASLIPNLVEAIRGYVEHGREVFEEVARARRIAASQQRWSGRRRELRDTLGKTLLVIGIVTTAILLLIGAAKFGMGPRKPRVDQPASPPPA